MATFNNGESGLSVRNKLNTIINKVEGVSTIDNDINVDGVNLSPIASTIADTAVDIFVYDTRKDSDGGAWRKRTQHTSWYNETLNTATRGSRKEFPAVAVIVAESNQVTIYDGDDPDLPMWMVFNTGGSANSALGQFTRTSTSALNGVLTTTSSQAAAGGQLSIIQFIDESIYSRRSTGGTQRGKYLGNISTRNDDSGWDLSTDQSIVDQYCNDVAMTVLPNAPIDAATGLPAVTIACATDGGVSVIKDDGTVVDDTTFSPINVISFGIDDDVFYGRNGFGRVYKWNYSADTSSTATYVTNATNPPIAGNTNGGIVDFGNNEYWAVGGNTEGLNVFAENKLAANITSEFNTGWMNGDIKLATLSDKYNASEPNVTGSELVTNGTFDTDATGWSAQNGATLSVVSGELEVAYGSSSSRAYQPLSSLAAGTYVITVDAYVGTAASFDIRIGNSSSTTTYGSAISQTNATKQTFTFTVTLTSTDSVYLFLYSNGTSGQTAYFDNVTVRLAEEDRSVNGNGLQVFGTVTKSAVASGADLVAYSGFSASNYLEQPYNSDLDFGTGDFCIMGWFKRTATSGNILDRGNGSDNTDRIQVHVFSGSQFRVVLDGTALATSAIPSGVWTHLTYARRSGVGYLYLNSNLETSGAQAGDVSNTYETKIGISQTLGDPCPGDLALLRISATAPTPEQIKKIYEDEKVLFQEGAQATLYGSSDAVTALAYDDSTNLLHVGTSAGRSVFQGLRRVDNTTTAVGAAISASNGLVADE